MCAKLANTPETDTCPHCHQAFQSIITHWNRSSSCRFTEYPDELLDITRGLFSVRGFVIKTDGKRRDKLEIAFTDRQKAERVYSLYGLYANLIQTNTFEPRNVEFYGKNFDSKGTTQYKVPLSPNPSIQSFSDIDWESAGELATKAALFVCARISNRSNAKIRLPVSKSERFEKVFSEYTSSRIQKSHSGDMLKNYEIPRRTLRKYEGIEWPIGWWNEDYMK